MCVSHSEINYESPIYQCNPYFVWFDQNWKYLIEKYLDYEGSNMSSEVLFLFDQTVSDDQA